MKKKTSLKDIAEKVGVSTALVSYVLNNKMKGRISKDVAARIREVAKEMNYSPNYAAKSLKTNTTKTIGLVVADIANPFFSSLARIIEDEAEKKGYIVLFGSSDESAEKSRKLVDVFLNRQVDGLLIASAANTELQIRDLQEHDIPFVLIDRYFPALKTSYVTIDNYAAANTAVQHLYQHGYQRIGLITFNTTLFNIQERKNGFMAAIHEHKLAENEHWIQEVPVNPSPAAVEKSVDYLLSLPQPPDAIVFASNILSTIGLKYINTLSIKVPDELAIVSFDESDASYLFYAPLTHIQQPIHAIGQQALQILFNSMEKKSAITQIKLEAQLIPGKSTAPAPRMQK